MRFRENGLASRGSTGPEQRGFIYRRTFGSGCASATALRFGGVEKGIAEKLAAVDVEVQARRLRWPLRWSIRNCSRASTLLILPQEVHQLAQRHPGKAGVARVDPRSSPAGSQTGAQNAQIADNGRPRGNRHR